MSKEIYISSTPHETRLAIVEKDELSEIYYERENEYTLAGSIYNGRVTRVLPGMQSAFVDVGLERDAFLYITDFLEEQGESADFESGEGRRSSGGGERQGERGRGRGERQGRGREEAPEAREAREPRSNPQESEAVEAEPDAERSPAGDESGMEGSRTWRGRRGRRRGRGGERGVAPSIAAEPESAEVSEAFAPRQEAEREALESVHGQAATEPYEREERSREGRGREGRGRGDRNGRGRDRGDRGGRGDHGDRDRPYEAAAAGGRGSSPEAEPFILPGESLSKYRRGDEPAREASASVAPKPQTSALRARPSTEIDLSSASWDGGFVLPGETLRRRGTTGAETRPMPAEGAGVEPQVAGQGFEPEAEQGAAQGIEDGESSGRDRRRERDRRRGRPGRGGRELQPSTAPVGEEESTPATFRSGAVAREELSPMEAVQPGVSSHHEPEADEVSLGGSVIDLGPVAEDDTAEGAPVQDLYYVASTDVVSTEEPSGAALAEAVDEVQRILSESAGVAPQLPEPELEEETTEYEPGEDASASYRVDPHGTTEYRQSGPAQDDDLEEGDPEVQADYAGTEHQYTTIDNAGEMLSELPGAVAVPGAEEDPTNPIEHETAVLSTRLSELDGSDVPTAQTAEAEAGPAPQAFAPGEGQLEEELMDDDEGELLDVAASYGDDTEEETFEAASAVGEQLSAFVRDLALDEMTGVELAVADEEDDFTFDEDGGEEFEESEETAGDEIAPVEEEEAATYETRGFDEESERPDPASMGAFPEFTEPEETSEGRPRESRNERGREVRRGGRDRGGRGGERRGTGNGRSNGRPSRHSMQTTDMPAISDLLKPGQEVLVQIAKEPIAKKGARITSHIALPGRFLVFMPTVNHVGVSRKIESDGERRRLKEILLSERGEAAGGFIVRTAAMGASEEELRSDLRFLLNLWADIKQRSESSKSPALIYHDLNLVERILRDQVTDNFSAIWVDTETEYERVLRFLQRFQPSLMRRVKLYTKDTPLFEQFGISEEINKALRSKVWLKSGGSIVINQTEALVAIDINTGKYVGKTARLEDTIVKTNLDAIPEIVRQIRLRDLGGIIVIDFIDMDDRKNRQRVLTTLEEELKNDRAPSKVLQFNDFGLVAITRKRVKQSLERTLSTTCSICTGTGMVKSPITVCNEIYIELRKMHKQLDKGDVMLRVNPEVVKQLKTNNAKWLQEMEEISGKTILVKSDPSLHPEQFDIH